MPTSSANYIFRPYNTGAANIHLEDWALTTKLDANKIRTIRDVLESGSAKVATSVPSPFARMHLFDTAFNMVASQPLGRGMYHQLVSDCLDMMQLLFTTAGSQDNGFSFQTWNRTERIAALRAKGPGHPHFLLANSLDLFFTGRFAGVQEFTLIYYRNVLMGGTSPLTLFYTSPNWQRSMQAASITLSSPSNHDVYFDEQYRALHERDTLFVDFVFKFYLAYRDRLNLTSTGFAAYIRNSIENFRPELAQQVSTTLAHYVNNPAALDGEYQRIAVVSGTSRFLEANGIFAYGVKTGDIPARIESESDFLLMPTVDFYRQEVDQSNNPTHPPRPLALERGMNAGGIYTYGKTPWSSATELRRSAYLDTFGESLPLGDRYLPGTQIRYPFLTTEDFLEDKLVRMPYQLNAEKFFTGATGDFPYLLPVKKAYFNFFTKADLREQLSINLTDTSLQVQLRIPVRTSRGMQQVRFTKDYPMSNTPVASCNADLGIFPFYRLTDEAPEVRALNEYTVLLADETAQPALHQLSFWQTHQVIGGKPIDVPKPAPRSLRGENTAASLYYKVPAEFDFIEVQLGSNPLELFRGLIIPEWKTINTRQSNKRFTVAIDFGTSNTHIALSQGVHQAPTPLTIGPEDMQMAMLHKPGAGKTAAQNYQLGMGSFTRMMTIVNQEFVPPVIGKEWGSLVSFPTRTATAEKPTFPSETPELFTNINAGFNVDADESTAINSVYSTNLKWRLENSRDLSDPHRIEAFFEEMLLLVRNKVILNDGILQDTRIAWLVPVSMKNMSREVFEQKWKLAFSRVFKQSRATLLSPVTESAAPYFYLKSLSEPNIQIFADAMNIDIGGGTSDVMLFLKKQERYLSTSFRFAGNDIWGDGHRNNNKDSGFLKNYDAFAASNKRAMEGPDFILERFRKDPNLSSEDVISLLFRYDDHFRFRESIQRYKPQLRLILFLHYSAIVYHLAELLTAQGLEVPRYFTFTGKGSEYINMMCGPEVLTQFTRVLLEAYTGKTAPQDFKVVLTQNPKQATANGAVLYVNSDEVDRINSGTISEVSEWGGNGGGSAGYSRGLTKVSQVLEDQEFHRSVLANAQRFVEITLRNPEVRRILAGYDIIQVEEVEQFLTNGDATRSGQLYDSYYTMLELLKVTANDGISETFFFLPFKDALYGLSKFIVSKL